ncbi:MAG: hypothetical protein CVU56_10470 [Deltaproteobacteria bacterium HGW-Deltaproteobacteria-14]|nr:MAG: hypothetical protein CVU56_10470 [Deltaproteobacteria bacterium HGW-Deltaproteobacteria-14]
MSDPRGPIVTPAATVSVGPEGFHRVRITGTGKLSLEDARAMHAARLSLGAEGRGLLVLVDIATRPSPSREAGEFTRRPEVQRLTRAMALLTPSVITRHLGNAFLLAMRPQYPTRIFTDEAAALGWLETFADAVATQGEH